MLTAHEIPWPACSSAPIYPITIFSYCSVFTSEGVIYTNHREKCPTNTFLEFFKEQSLKLWSRVSPDSKQAFEEGNCGCKKDWHTRWRQRGCVALLNRSLYVFLLFLTLWQVKLCASFSLLRGNCWNICSVEQNETNIPAGQFALQTELVPNTLQDPENVCCHRESWRKTSTWLSVSLSAAFKSWTWKQCWGSEMMLGTSQLSLVP